ncbi:hypothetical protein [Burkholderia ubonensis]|uniref:hypothetical protein n=1 Tax=Burkholderia ubonensis TaxID=101571 RepID=UPI00075DE9FE|nr:hypothetical protein [Burkholderia ubonensis]AOI70848.1 hypothetical protein WI31_15620 [Burkholderia ubonensis]KUZ07393.1 hypothetical protein WI29_34075 [Burkholderia ubonensis]KUZ20634.1 hypothetical protein WI30_01265 [Burkholderia ubonensis]KUZ33372.1 hypothetical protein WI32_19785 [Burkholderia ubonensis]KUZ44791.1 hypothetical protein WI33_28010 [Burkholderia ubonensis]
MLIHTVLREDGKKSYCPHNPDQEIIVRKTFLARLIGLIFPAIGPGQLPVVPDLGALPDQVGLVNAILGINPLQEAIYNSASNTTAFTASGSQISGAAQCFFNLTGTLGAGAALTLPTVANLIASLPSVVQANPIGLTWQLRVINSSGGAFAWTVTTNTGWTLSGTSQAIAQSTFQDYVVTITSATTASMQAVGKGTGPA